MKLIHYRSAVPNFGDDLNAELWPALAPRIFTDPDDGQGFVGIGTVIGMDVGAVRRLAIFSSGAGYDDVGNWANRTVDVHCVRGPMTARLLGIDPALALTDGAILVPLAPGFPTARTGGKGTIVIPHFQTLAFPGWEAACRMAGMTLVDPRRPPADVIAAIAGAGLVLTESLHGAILADVYGIPWIAFGTSGNLSTSKWVDWLATLGLDFSTTLVPPPNAAQLLAFGRRPEPYGTRLDFTLDRAIAEFEQRVAPRAKPSRGKALAKALVARTPLQRLLGFAPARTAEALTALARGAAVTSVEARRAALRDAMIDKLEALDRSFA